MHITFEEEIFTVTLTHPHAEVQTSFAAPPGTTADRLRDIVKNHFSEMTDMAGITIVPAKPPMSDADLQALIDNNKCLSYWGNDEPNKLFAKLAAHVPMVSRTRLRVMINDEARSHNWRLELAPIA
jgi:hypothetical protein